MRQMLQPIFAVLAALLMVTAVPAQQPTAQITAIITDSSGAVGTAAQIKVVNTETGMHWEAQSNESGDSVFSNLRPGNYEITVSRDGFATVNRGGINLVISQVGRGSTSHSRWGAPVKAWKSRRRRLCSRAPRLRWDR